MRILREERLTTAGGSADCLVVKLTYPSSSDLFWIDKSNYHVLRKDEGDARVVFETIRLNEKLPDELFEFKPPKGAQGRALVFHVPFTDPIPGTRPKSTALQIDSWHKNRNQSPGITPCISIRYYPLPPQHAPSENHPSHPEAKSLVPSSEPRPRNARKRPAGNAAPIVNSMSLAARTTSGPAPGG